MSAELQSLLDKYNPSTDTTPDVTAVEQPLNDDGSVYTDDDEERERTEIAKAANALSPGIKVQIVGRYVWASGLATKDFRAWFKTQDFFWARNKKAWMWKPRNASSRKWGKRPQEMGMGAIVSRYGSVDVDEDE